MVFLDKQGKKNEEEGVLSSNQNHLPSKLRFRAGCTVNLRSDIGLKVREIFSIYTLNKN